MQFGVFDNLHRHPREISRRPFDAARYFLNRVSKLFHNPLAIALLVWGFLFLILSVALTYAQDASQAVDQRHTIINPRAATERAVCDKKTEAVEIFSAGEDLVIPPPAAVKAPSRRRTVAVGRRAHPLRFGACAHLLNTATRASKRLPLRTPACLRARRRTSVLPVSLHAGEFLHRLQILCLLFNTLPADGTIISDAS